MYFLVKIGKDVRKARFIAEIPLTAGEMSDNLLKANAMKGRAFQRKPSERMRLG